MADHTSEHLPACPSCSSVHTYELGTLLVCPECAHEWVAEDGTDVTNNGGGVDEPHEIKDSAGNILSDGDTVTVIRGLKVKGRDSIKVGTKVRNIRLVDGVGDHDIECKIEGFGVMQLKSSVVRKVS